MNKKILFSLGVFVSACTSLLGFNGFYVGGHLGGELLDGRQPGMGFGSLTTAAQNIYTSNHNTDYFDERLTADLCAGLGWRYRCIYAGFEIFGKYARHHVDEVYQSNHIFPAEPASEGIFGHNNAVLGSWQYGIDFRPGILLTPQTLFYGRIGVTSTKIKFNTHITNELVESATTFDVSSSDSQHKHGHYLRCGLGMEQFLTPHLAVRWDYIFTNYRSLSAQSSNSGTSAGNTLDVRSTDQLHLKTHALTLGLGYYFCPYPEYCEQKYNCLIGPNFCGWYVGAGVGGGFENSAHNIDFTTVVSGGGAETAEHPHIAKRWINEKAIRSMIFGGYSLQFNLPWTALFAGAELFAQYAPYTNSGSGRALFSDGFNQAAFSIATQLTSELTIEPWQYGVQFRPGILLSPSTLLYGTVGTSVAKINAKHKATVTSPTTGATLDLSLSEKKRRAVLRLGGGLEYVLYGHWHLRGDYIYTNYRSLNLSGSFSQTTTRVISVMGSSQIHLKDHAVTLNLVRYF